MVKQKFYSSFALSLSCSEFSGMNTKPESKRLRQEEIKEKVPFSVASV